MSQEEKNGLASIHTPKPVMSRRAFLGVLGTGAATLFIDYLSGGAVVATAKEFAAMATGQTSSSIQFITIAYDQVAVTVLDAADSHRFVEGATVRVQTLADGRDGAMVEAVTDHLGVALLDATNLAESSLLGGTGHDFFGKVFVTKEGCRDFETGMMRFYGGKATGVYLQEADGKPYVRCLTMDGYDIQYMKQTFLSTTEATIDHALKAVVVCDGANKEIEVNYWSGEPRTSNYLENGTSGKTALSAAVDTTSANSFYKGASGKFAGEVTFTHPYFDPAQTRWFLGIGQPLHLHVWVDRANRFRVDAKLEVEQGVIPKPRRGSDNEELDRFSLRLNSDEDHYDGFNAELPEWIPGISKFGVWVPSFPGGVNVAGVITPGGELMFSISMTFKDMYYDKGGKTEKEKLEEAQKAGGVAPVETGWQNTPTQTVAEQVEEQWANWNNGIQRYREALDSQIKDPGGYNNNPFKGGRLKMGWSVSAGYTLLGKYAKELARWEGTANIFGKTVFSLQYSKLFMATIYPITVTFDLSASVMIKVGCTWALPEDAGLALNRIYLAKGGVTLPFKIYVALTVALGVAGVASVGVRGAGWLYINLYLQGGEETTGVGGEAGISVLVVAEIFIFHYEWELWSKSFKFGKDATAAALSAQDVSGQLACASFADLDNLFTPFTDDGMFEAAEFTLTPAQGEDAVSPLSDDDVDHEIAWECTYEPHTAGGGIQDVSAAAVILADDDSYRPQEERRIIANSYANSRIKFVYQNGAAVAAFRIVMVDFYHTQQVIRPRVSYIPISGSGDLSFGNPVVTNSRKNAGYIWLNTNEWDSDFASVDLTSQGWCWAAAVLYTDHNPLGVADSMANSKLVIRFAKHLMLGAGGLYDYEFEVTRPDYIKPGGGEGQYMAFNNLSLVQLPDNKVGFSCGYVTYNDPNDATPLGMGIISAVYSLDGDTVTIMPKHNEGTYNLNPFRVPSGYTVGMSSMDSVMAMPPNSKAPGYEEGVFDIVCTVQMKNAAGQIRRKIFFTNNDLYMRGMMWDQPRFVDPFAGEDYNFLGNFECWTRTVKGSSEGMTLGRFLGDVANQDPDESIVGKLLAYRYTAYGLETPPYGGRWPAVSPVEVGPADMAVDYGCFQLSPDGNLLFFTKTFNGDVPEGEVDQSAAISEVPPERHQICAARFINGRFTDPFPLVDLSYSPDSFQYVPRSYGSFGSDAYYFLYSHITDTTKGLSDTYMVKMPYLKRITLLGIFTAEPAISVGATLNLEITARNDGNVILAGFTVRFTGESGFSKDVRCDCSLESYITNAYDGVHSTKTTIEADLAAQSGVFYMGHTNTYKMQVETPADWPAGEHTISAVILEDSLETTTAELHAEWAEDETVAACALSYTDPDPIVFMCASADEADLRADAPAEGEESAHASDYTDE